MTPQTGIVLTHEKLSFEKLKGKAQAVVAPRFVRRVAVPTRHTAIPGVEVPATATNHAVSARIRSRGVRLVFTAVIAIPILTPLIYVATHVIESQFVR